MIVRNYKGGEARSAWEDGSDLDKNVINKPVETEIVENPFDTTTVIDEDGTVTEINNADMPDFLKE